MSLQNLIDLNPVIALQEHLEELSPEQLRHCARRQPALALRIAGNRLNPDSLLYCFKAEPGEALKSAPDLLYKYKILFDFCVRSQPLVALAYVPDKLSDELLNYCVTLCPSAAYGDFTEWFNEDLLEVDTSQDVELVSMFPKSTELLANRLDDTSFDYFVTTNPESAIKRAFHRLNEKQLHFCLTRKPSTAMYCKEDKLTDSQFAYCLNIAPNCAFHIRNFSRLTTEQLIYSCYCCPFDALFHCGHLLPNDILLKVVLENEDTVILIIQDNHMLPEVKRLVKALFKISESIPPGLQDVLSIAAAKTI